MQNDEGADADRRDHAPGYQDFFASPRNKKRVLPVAPQQKRLMAQSSLIDSYEESYSEKVIVNIFCVFVRVCMHAHVCTHVYVCVSE